MAGVFILIEWKVAKYPIVPLDIFNPASTVGAILTALLHGLVYIDGVFYVPLYFQSDLGASPLLSGVCLLPFALALCLSAVATGIYIQAQGRHTDCIYFGFIFLILGFGLFLDLPKFRMWAKIVIYQIVAGLGVGPNFQAAPIALQNNTPAQDNATTTSLYQFVRNLPTSIGVVVGNVVFTNTMQSHYAEMVKSLGAFTADLLSGKTAIAHASLSTN